MATTAPPILPISTPTTTTTTTSDPPISTPAFRAFVTRLTDQLKDGLSQRRPWAELLDRTAFTKPESITEATTRLRKNYSYFRVNYLSFLALVILFSLLTHPFSLLTLASLFAAWSFLYLFKPADRPVVLFGRTFSERETLGLLVVSSVFVVFLTNVGSVLISALLLGAAVVCCHGAFRVPEDLFLDDQDSGSQTDGLLSFLGGAAKNAAAAATPSSV